MCYTENGTCYTENGTCSTGATQSLSSTSMSECCGTHNGLSYQSPSGVCTPYYYYIIFITVQQSKDYNAQV